MAGFSEPEPMLIYKTLRARFGFRNWWPGDTPFEILVGAVLTQQTTWKNVEKAISNLAEENILSLDGIESIGIKRLERLIRPSGYYRQKAARLKDICKKIKNEYGSLDNLFAMDKDKIRKILLSYKGIGKETADSIVLYAANKPIFVIDAYTRRAMHRINPKIRADISYDDLQQYFEQRIKREANIYNDFHAQFVELGKRYCKASKPLCWDCPLNRICYFGIISQRDTSSKIRSGNKALKAI